MRQPPFESGAGLYLSQATHLPQAIHLPQATHLPQVYAILVSRF